MRWALAGLLSLLPSYAAPQQPAPTPSGPPRDTIYLAGRGDDLAPGGSGAAFGAGWIRIVNDRLTTELGAQAARLGPSRWAYGRLGLHLRLDGKTRGRAELELGGGEEDADDFPYRIVRFGLVRELVPRRLYLELEDQILRVDEARGHVLAVGANALLGSRWSAAASYRFSAGGNLDAQFVSLRLELQLRRVLLLGGVVLGRTRPELLNLLPAAQEAGSTTEVYTGLTLPLGGSSLTLVLDTTHVEGVRRDALLASWKLPL